MLVTIMVKASPLSLKHETAFSLVEILVFNAGVDPLLMPFAVTSMGTL